MQITCLDCHLFDPRCCRFCDRLLSLLPPHWACTLTLSLSSYPTSNLLTHNLLRDRGRSDLPSVTWPTHVSKPTTSFCQNLGKVKRDCISLLSVHLPRNLTLWQAYVSMKGLSEFSSFPLTVMPASTRSHRNLTPSNKQTTVNAKSQQAARASHAGGLAGGLVIIFTVSTWH